MMGWQWHQLDHTQIIYTSLQADNNASTSPLSFYRPNAHPAAQPKVSSTEGYWVTLKTTEIFKFMHPQKTHCPHLQYIS